MLFDTTVRKEITRTFSATVVVVLTIVLTMMLIRTLGLAASGGVAPQDVLLAMGYVVLSQLPMVLAISMYVSIVISLARMYRDSEMAVWFSSGIGLSAFVRPVLLAGWPMVAVVAFLALAAGPWAYRQTGELRTRYEQRADLLRVAPGTFQSSSDGNRVFFVERAGDAVTGARNVFLLAQKDGRETVTTARAGRLTTEGDARVLTLESGHRNEVDANTGEHTRIAFESFRMVADDEAVRSAQAPAPRTLPTWSLVTDATPRNRGELVSRLGVVLGAFNLLLLAIGTSATHPRRPSSFNLLAALLTYFIYYNLINVSQAWVGSGRVGVVTALVLLHGGGFCLAIALLRWREWGTVSRGRVRHIRATA